MAYIVLQAVRLDPRVAGVAQRAARVLDEPRVRELHAALLATEARRVPVRVHRLYNAADDEFTWE